ncbi:helix-turn-helix transcriptional regulator [Paenibacillus dendritiformis]|uniref:helix-turn-helix domain-containing protein n=1 Tax=Paenibacillus dendritiformis TaxID=130049 RepID=UPI00248C5886|nr:helix-turn-helix transcriptional regulator [Paenibacillus dendritiformis]WGU95123.1 helix-turn-helix transcriptional regulator [Paenibacillus dendritiformis]
MNIGKILKELRGKRSLREIERESGVSHTYLSSLEKGRDPRTGKERKPTPDTLKKLAHVYSVPYEWLMSAAGYMDVDEGSSDPGHENGEHPAAQADGAGWNYRAGGNRLAPRGVKEKKPFYELTEVLNGSVPVHYYGQPLSREDRERALAMLEVLFPGRSPASDAPKEEDR